MFFQIIGLILLGILILLLILLLMPVCLKPEYKNEELTIYLKILFLRFKVFPLTKKEKKKVEKAEKKAEQQAQTEVKKIKKEKFPIYLEDISTIITTAKGALKIIFKGIFFRNIRILYPVYKKDAAQTAIFYGQLQVYVASAFAAMQNVLHLKFKSLKLVADFNNEFSKSTYLSCKIYASLIVFVIAGIYVFKELKASRII